MAVADSSARWDLIPREIPKEPEDPRLFQPWERKQKFWFMLQPIDCVRSGSFFFYGSPQNGWLRSFSISFQTTKMGYPQKWGTQKQRRALAPPRPHVSYKEHHALNESLPFEAHTRVPSRPNKTSHTQKAGGCALVDANLWITPCLGVSFFESPFCLVLLKQVKRDTLFLGGGSPKKRHPVLVGF